LFKESTAAEYNPLQALFDMMKFEGIEGRRNLLDLNPHQIKLENPIKVRFVW
jgi:hypothetical protein